MLQGKHRCSPPSSIAHPLLQRLQASRDESHSSRSIWPSHVIHYLRFTSAISTAQYYSERYEAYREADDLTLKNWLKARMGEIDEQKLRKTSEVLGVEKLLDGSLMNLSNGQQRRARIVKALLHDPEVLLLEEPYSIPTLCCTNRQWVWMCLQERRYRRYFQMSRQQRHRGS